MRIAGATSYCESARSQVFQLASWASQFMYYYVTDYQIAGLKMSCCDGLFFIMTSDISAMTQRVKFIWFNVGL